MTFGELSVGEWFLRDGRLCQRVLPLNTSNTYVLTGNGAKAWAHTPAKEPVSATVAPTHFVPRMAVETDRTMPGRVLFWHPCGFWDICRRSDLREGEPYIPLDALPVLERINHCCVHENRLKA